MKEKSDSALETHESKEAPPKMLGKHGSGLSFGDKNKLMIIVPK
jgi:hypothetical protein